MSTSRIVYLLSGFLVFVLVFTNSASFTAAFDTFSVDLLEKNEKPLLFDQQLNRLFATDRFMLDHATADTQSFETVYRGLPSLASLIKKPSGLRIRGSLFYDHTRVFPKNAGNMRSEMSGFLLGADLLYQGGGVFGAYYMYGSEETSWDAKDNPLEGDVKHHLLGLQYKKNMSFAHFLLNGSLGKDEYDYNGEVFEKYMGDGYQGNVYVELGIGLSQGGQSIGFKPFWGVHYHFLKLDDDLEIDDYTNFDNYKSIVDSVEHGLNNILGLRFNMVLFSGTINAQVRASWVYEYLDPSPTSTNYFGAIPGQYTPLRWNVEGDTSRNWAWLGCGVKFSLGEKLLFFLDYDANFNKYQTSHTGSIYACINF